MGREAALRLATVNLLYRVELLLLESVKWQRIISISQCCFAERWRVKSFEESLGKEFFPKAWAGCREMTWNRQNSGVSNGEMHWGVWRRRERGIGYHNLYREMGTGLGADRYELRPSNTVSFCSLRGGLCQGAIFHRV